MKYIYAKCGLPLLSHEYFLLLFFKQVFSEIARRPNFHPSVLERLFYWSKEHNCNNTHFLTDNYRMRQEILDFIGVHCYKIENFKVDQRHHQQTNFKLDPLMFSVVEGKEETKGLSYINAAEVRAKPISQYINKNSSQEFGLFFEAHGWKHYASCYLMLLDFKLG